MKTAQDPRHQKRIHMMEQLFRLGFPGAKYSPVVTPVLQALPAIDASIQQAAPEWPIDKISKIDVSILRLAVWELTVNQTQPPKVVIDEAVELAKSYGNENSAKFVNGVLGTLLKTLSCRKK